MPAISFHTANAAAGRGLSRIALTLLAAMTGLACKQDEGSSLRDRSQPVVEAGPAAGGASAPEAPAQAEPEAAPPEDAELVSLHLALPQDETYRITTVAMVELPMVNQPVGWAREEEITFEQCDGEAENRGCTLRHRSTAFEGQPPTGPMLEADERKVQPVTSRHRITAVGFREGPTALEVDDSAAVEPDLEQSLAAVHRFYCIRFPKQPVAVGAKWNDTCQTFDRGIAVTRNVLWELSELSDDPDDPDAGKRAELRAIGEYVVPGPKGERKGTIETILYFSVDRGEPHLIRERRSIPVSAERGAYTKETINIQFAKVIAGEPPQVVRTDGKPFPEPSAAPSEADPAPSEADP